MGQSASPGEGADPTGIDIVHIPFKGGAQAYPEVMAGQRRPMLRR